MAVERSPEDATRRRTVGATAASTPDTSQGVFRSARESFPFWDRIVEEIQADLIEFSQGEGSTAAPDPNSFARLVSDAITRNPSWGIKPAAFPALNSALYEEFFGMGPLAPYLSRDGVEEVLANTYNDVFVIEGGTKHQIKPSPFRTEQDLRNFLARIFAGQGRQLSIANPAEDGQLSDGSRIHAQVPPLSPHGAAFSIRKFRNAVFTSADYIASGMYTEEFRDDLGAWIQGDMNILISGGTGSGKAQPLDAQILTPAGFVPMGAIRAGDSVISSAGVPTRVRGVYPQGEKQVFRVEFSDGASTECCADHLWSVQTRKDRHRGRPPRTMSLMELSATDLRDGEGHRWFVPLMDAHLGDPDVKLPLDPYLLGALIGDGSLTQSTPQITTLDTEMVFHTENALPRGMWANKVGNSLSFRLTDGRQGGGDLYKNPLRSSLEGLGLCGNRAEHKFIPECYLRASPDDRFALLQGLLDSDGSADAVKNSIEFSTTSETLAHQVVALVRSLGGTSRTTGRTTRYPYAGEVRQGRPSWRVRVSLPPTLPAPFRVSRKAERCNPRTTPPTRAVTAITPVGRKACQCISVEAEDGLYVTDDYIVTHNTTLINSIGEFIPKEDRLIVIENSLELQLKTDDTHYMQTVMRGATEGRGDEKSLTIRDCLRYALRLRPDRIIVGEVRSAEAYDLLQAMNTGHDGSLTTVHADAGIDAIARLESLAIQAGELPIASIQELMARAIDIIIQVTRHKGTSRREIVEAWQVIHPLQVPDEEKANMASLRDRGQLIQIRPQLWMIPLYRRNDGGELVRLSGTVKTY